MSRGDDIDTLDLDRERAALISSCQRIAVPYYYGFVEEQARVSGEHWSTIIFRDASRKVTASPSVSNQREDPPERRAWLDQAQAIMHMKNVQSFLEKMRGSSGELGLEWKNSISESTWWRIPREKILQEILVSCPFATPYIWIDLLCIPQDVEDANLKSMAIREIGRQTKIFQSARFAVAWLNDIDSWNGLERAIRLLAVFRLKLEDQLEISSSLWKSVMKDDFVSLELLLPGPHVHDDSNASLNGWLTSLWTLQELCLRPDMRLCNQHWEILPVGSINRHCDIGLDDIAALSLYVLQVIPDEERNTQSTDASLRNQCVVSRIFEELRSLERKGHLVTLLNAPRSSILQACADRYCERNRAEAIMSAIGVTDWYTERTQTGEETSVGGSANEYPLSFVREAAKKLGATFFFASGIIWNVKRLLLESTPLPTGARNAICSMMPFKIVLQRLTSG
ncbi:uncharacterized protein Z518_00524 [Rhinocladiella mackenziei CBS 650.93]|uniref:Rhinocladiella mackenziei CBS 650.93 unplaced genomic scaffold supercont1.1, whole genome shotgun sequence n=1 Tax=Rhinocladiella mackenziei CBS 650.93 TaxID=1442369 RepID=A0A0D2ITM4_9EURO|nr:uncharacterized protein Z518_00524 [Rhinocladiella mackenziei CBS 650.93]KIX09444.1 hypothetical protein Z518_00524 [Rhinocladiella mackenziei CBS 650.93]